ncbi:Flp family type IVb pilin [Vibrio owensii]|uniref:Flp family type IVb pilin n=1 Tax=Vibrio owensii TaxID=696485 RepID=UPI0015D0980A|nr:Flp family type IVb pilin [Vibrio owensii]
MRNFTINERGVTAIEYAMLAVFTSMMMLIVFGLDNPIKQALILAIESVANNISSASANR